MGRTPITYLLDKRGTHERATFTKDASGSSSPAWATQTANIKFSIWPVTTEVRSDYKRADIVVTHQIALDVDIAAKKADRISYAGNYYLVHGVNPFSNSFIANYPVYVLDVEQRIV